MIEVSQSAAGKLRIKDSSGEFDADALRREIKRAKLSNSTKVRKAKDAFVVSFDQEHELAILQLILKLGYSIHVGHQVGGSLVRAKAYVQAQRAVHRINEGLRRFSHDEVDLRTIFMIVCAGLGLIQLSRGKFLPSGLVLFLHSSRFMESD